MNGEDATLLLIHAATTHFLFARDVLGDALQDESGVSVQAAHAIASLSALRGAIVTVINALPVTGARRRDILEALHVSDQDAAQADGIEATQALLALLDGVSLLDDGVIRSVQAAKESARA